MAKGTTIGFLNFGIDGDNKELLKAIKQAEDKAISLDKFMSNMKIGLNTNSMTSDLQKAALSTDKLAVSNNKVAKSAADMALSETKAANQVLKDTQNLMYQEERLAGLRKRNSLIGVQGQKDLASAYGLTNKTMFSQKNLLQQLSGAAGIYFSVYQVAGFVKELATVSGEFEKQRVSLAAIIGDADAANKIFNQIKDLAVISPFNFKELTDYAKQLSAFSIPTNEIYDTTKRLADLSAGLGVDMSRIILAYGQVRSAAVLRGQELRQFTEAGIPLVDELAKKFGELEGRVVSAGEVFDKISNRQASFGMVKEIINDLTSEGGKFFEMQELQSATLTGKISNLRDNYDMMLDSLGKANSGLLHGAMDGLVDVMDNWEKYFGILKSIIFAYGAYKAAIIASSIATQGLTASIKGCAAAQALFNSVSKLNPYALLAAGIAAAISGLISFSSAQDEAREELYKTIGIINNQVESVNNLIGKLKELTSKAEDDVKAQKERSAIIEQLAKTEPLLASYIKDHATNLKELTKAQKEYNDLMDAQKLAEYIADESSGWFKDGVKDDLKDLADAQNKLNVATAGLDTTYTKLIEGINKIKEKGGVQTPMGLKEFNKATLAEIDKIIASEKTRAEKLSDVYDLLDPSKRWRGGIGKNASTLESNFGESIFGTPGSGKFSEYIKALNDFRLSANDANSGLDELSIRVSGFLDNTGSGVDKLNDLKAKFESLAGISYKDLLGKDADEQAKYLTRDVEKLYTEIQSGESRLKGLVNNLEWLGKYGKERILTKWDIEINGSQDLSIPLDGWKKELHDLVGTSIKIDVESNLNEVSDEIVKRYKELRTRIDEQKPILIKAGFDFGTSTFTNGSGALSPTIIQMGDNFKADTKEAKSLESALKLLGKTADDALGKKKDSKKDPIAEKLKKRIDLLKDARSEYDKLVKAGNSNDDAANYLMGLESFKGIDARNYEKDIQKIIDYLKKKGKSISKEQADILSSLTLGVDKESISKKAEQLAKDSKEAIEKIDKELSQYKEQYSLYEYIFGKTGDRNQAMNIAFGDIQGQVKTYRDYLVSAIEKATDSDQKKKLENDLFQFDQAEASDFAKKMTDLLIKYQTTEEKISLITKQGEEEREKIRAKYGETDYATKLIENSKRNQTEQIDALKTELFQLTPFYRELFGSLSDYSYRHLNQLSKKAKETVEEIASTLNSDGLLKFGRYDGSNKLTGYYQPINGEIVKDENGQIKNSVISLKEYEKILKRINEIRSQMSNQNPLAELLKPMSEYYTIGENGEKQMMSQADIMTSKFEAFGQVAQQVGGDLSNMFASLGDEDAAETVAFIGDMAGSLSNIGAGIASGNYIQAAQGIIKSITSIANFHDKKLDRAIKRSQLEVKKLGNAYAQIERTVSRQLGAVTESQAKAMAKNQENQIKELEKQRAAEAKKKKKDKGVISDLDGQIDEAKEKLRYFYEDLAGEQWGISIKDWAGQISSALVDAFASGENAADAFDRSVADIMKNVIKNMIQLAVIEPAMEKLRTKLFGEDGKGGLLGGGTTNLSKKDAAEIVSSLAGFKDKVEDAQGIWDYLNEAAKQAGIDLTDMSDSAKDTLSKGIQSITEDTGDILASYMNAMRAEQARQGVLISNIIAIAQTHTDQFANMYAELLRIQVNTLATANNTAAIAQTTESTYNLLKSATIKGSGTVIQLS